MANVLRDHQIKLLRDEIQTNSQDSPLLNPWIMKNKQWDDPYLNAEQLFDEFLIIEDKIFGINYSQSMILELVQEWLGDRYEAFYRKYHSMYPKVSPAPVNIYIKNFNECMEIEIKLRGFKRYKNGVDADYLEKVDKSLATVITYFRAINKQDLAHEIWKHYTETLEKPLTKRFFIAEQVKLYAPRMSKKCQIQQKEAKMHLRKNLNKILS